MPIGEGGRFVPPEYQHMSEQEKKENDPVPPVPESEMHFSFSASGGPGGQNVNKVASKATLRWNVGGSGAYTEEQKAVIRAYAGNRLNKEDEIVLSSNEQRSQLQNRESVVERLRNLVGEALAPKAERVETKPSYGQKQKRLDEKRREGDKKRERRKGRGEW